MELTPQPDGWPKWGWVNPAAIAAWVVTLLTHDVIQGGFEHLARS